MQDFDPAVCNISSKWVSPRPFYFYNLQISPHWWWIMAIFDKNITEMQINYGSAYMWVRFFCRNTIFVEGCWHFIKSGSFRKCLPAALVFFEYFLFAKRAAVPVRCLRSKVAWCLKMKQTLRWKHIVSAHVNNKQNHLPTLMDATLEWFHLNAGVESQTTNSATRCR